MPPIFNYARRDYSAVFEDFLTKLKAYLPEYTDFNHSDAGIALGRLNARDLDQLHFYIDHIAAEGCVSTAQFRQSLIDLGLLVGYLPTLAAAASTRLRLTRATGVTGAVSIPKYSAFTRADGLAYLTVEAVSIAADAQNVEVNAVQGTLVEQEFEASDFHVTDWTKHPRVNLGKGLVGGYVEVWHGNPVQVWTSIDSWWRSWPEDLHFLLELNGDTEEVWLVLGDGVKGTLPPADTLHVRFIRTAEASGNCGHSVIYGLPDGFSGVISCTNIEPATGGAAAEDIASIRRMIPAMVRTQRRGLTRTDYEALIEHMPGVLHVQALDRNDAVRWPHDHVVLYVVPDGGGPMSSLLKDQIWAECGSWGHLGPWKERYILLDAVAVPLNVSMRIGVLQSYTPESVRAAVEAAVTSLLAAQNRTIGGTLEFSELQRTANAVAGLSWVEFDGPKEDVKSSNGEIITPGVITATVS
jgi:hypothetical protein